jgi:hypothetical protein
MLVNQKQQPEELPWHIPRVPQVLGASYDRWFDVQISSSPYGQFSNEGVVSVTMQATNDTQHQRDTPRNTR